MASGSFLISRWVLMDLLNELPLFSEFKFTKLKPTDDSDVFEIQAESHHFQNDELYYLKFERINGDTKFIGAEKYREDSAYRTLTPLVSEV